MSHQLAKGEAARIGDNRLAKQPGLADHNAETLAFAHRHYADAILQRADDRSARLLSQDVDGRLLDPLAILVRTDQDEIGRRASVAQCPMRRQDAAIVLARRLAAQDQKEGVLALVDRPKLRAGLIVDVLVRID